MIPVIHGRMPQLEALDIHIRNYDKSFTTDAFLLAPRLTSVTMKWLGMENVKLQWANIEHLDCAADPWEVAQMLGVCANLQDLLIRSVFSFSSSVIAIGAGMIESNLTNVSIGVDECEQDLGLGSTLNLLACVSLPHLRSLLFFGENPPPLTLWAVQAAQESRWSNVPTTLSALASRSKCPLTDISFTNLRTMSKNLVIQFLVVLPTLTTVKFESCASINDSRSFVYQRSPGFRIIQGPQPVAASKQSSR
jgi:hypothetical protein